MRKSQAAQKIMFVAGPNEFLPSEAGDTPPPPEALPVLSKVYAMLDYNVGYLAAAEGKALAGVGANVPPRFLVAGDAPQKMVYTVGAEKIGVVFFPELGRAANPSDSTVRGIDKMAESLRGEVKLVIGLSPWGSEAERYYLEHAKPAVDVLLGGGPGIGLTARPDKTGKVLWMRSFSKGKTLDTVDILAWPGAPDFKWADKGNFVFQIISLGDDTPAKPEIEAVLAGAESKEVKAK